MDLSYRLVCWQKYVQTVDYCLIFELVDSSGRGEAASTGIDVYFERLQSRFQAIQPA